ncbi:hypothetical protein KR222_004520 [Zaprionus bogoriensis]|nr:hypothetical protein KR222_004520 [Zaprionus bogoriensis]
MENKSQLESLLSETKAGSKLSEYHMKVLKKHNICTANDFVEAEHLHKQLALPAEQIECIKRELLALLVKGVKLQSLLKAEPRNYSTGIADLDKLLACVGQPLRPARIWELYSESGVGKTELLHTLAVNFVGQDRDKHNVLYIDTKRDFDSVRIEQLLLERQLAEEQLQHCLNAIKVIEVASAHELIAALEDLLQRLSTADETVAGIKLVLLDSLSASFILLRNSHERNAGRSFLTQLAALLRRLATQHGLAFIMSNLSDEENVGVIDDIGDAASQAGTQTQDSYSLLGEYWSSVCTLTLELQLPDDESSGSDGLRLLRVLSNSYGPSESSCLLRITDEGVI